MIFETKIDWYVYNVYTYLEINIYTFFPPIANFKCTP